MIKETIYLLGLRATDKVTGYKGVISSVCFDLYGCVQASLTPPAKEGDQELKHGHWFDVQRLDVELAERVMKVPDFEALAQVPEEFSSGPAEKAPPRL